MMQTKDYLNSVVEKKPLQQKIFVLNTIIPIITLHQGRLTVTVYSMCVRAASFTTDMTLNGNLMLRRKCYKAGSP